MKVYFDKMQNTNDKSITKFYYNKFDPNYNNLDFLKKKIIDLIKSPKTTESIKKLLIKLKDFNFDQYDCFYIYASKLIFGIKTQEKTIDFYDNKFDCVIKLKDYFYNYNCKLPKIKKDQSDQEKESDQIDPSDLIGSDQSDQ